LRKQASNDSQTKLSKTNIRETFLGNTVKIFILHTMDINRELLVLQSKWVIKSQTINRRKKIWRGKRRRLPL
jgi:hypothetical protein